MRLRRLRESRRQGSILGRFSGPRRLQVALESLLGPLGPVLVALGTVLRRSGELLARSWGILRRSWVALGGSWAGLRGSWLGPRRSLGAKRARRAADQGACVTNGKRSYPPPSEIRDLGPHPSRQFHYFPGPGERGKEDVWNMEGIVEHHGGHCGNIDHQRVEERCPARPEAQGAGGF